MGIEDIAATGISTIGTVAVTKVAADTVSKVVRGRMPKTKLGNLPRRTRTTRTPIKSGSRSTNIFKMYSGKRKRY